MLVFDGPQRMLTQWFSSNSMVISASGTSFTQSCVCAHWNSARPYFFTLARQCPSGGKIREAVRTCCRLRLTVCCGSGCSARARLALRAG
jgi:hypothetical protein